MRYRLRTLVILMGIGPPVIAGLWLSRDAREILFYSCVFAAVWILVLGFVLAHSVSYTVVREPIGSRGGAEARGGRSSNTKDRKIREGC
jgi:hypothetical protein